jgi:hypothetical protein
MGEVLAKMPKDNGDPRSHDVTRLSDLGIHKMMSSRCQAIATVPEDEFEQTISAALNSGREVTANELQKMGREIKKQVQREKRREKKLAELNGHASVDPARR